MRYIERPCLKNKRQIKEELKEEKEKRRDWEKERKEGNLFWV
jgi:hypothetical protein